MEQPIDILYSDTAEREVIGSMLLKPSLIDNIIAECGIVANDFYHAENKKLFACICKMRDKNEDINLVTVCSALNYRENSPQFEHLREIIIHTPTTTSACSYANEVKKMAVRRERAEVLRLALECNVDMSKDADSIFPILDNILRADELDKEIVFAADLFQKVYDEIVTKYENEGEIPGEYTGWTTLDKKLGGMEGGELIIIGGRPGMGKSTIAQNIAENIALRRNEVVAIFSAEMPKEQVLKRIISSRAGVLARRVRTGLLENNDFEAIGNLANAPELKKLAIFDKSLPELGYIKSVCRQLKRRFGLRAVIVDYLQIMKTSDKAWSKADGIGEITGGLKLLAKELNIPIICLSQLSRKNEHEKDKRPTLADLRDSGAIEQDADKVLLLYRDEYYNPETTKKGIMEVIIAKNRQGEMATVELSWQGHIMRVMEKKDIEAIAKRRNEQNPWNGSRERIQGQQVNI